MRQLIDLTQQRPMLSRREIMTGLAVCAGISSVASSLVWAESEEISRSAESIHQEPTFKAKRKSVYEALTHATQFDKVSQLGAAVQSGASLGNSPTEISGQVGGSFTIFKGHIVGRHIELVPNERIVQAWRVVTWEPGIFSIARFVLVDQGSGTKIIFDHTGFRRDRRSTWPSGGKATTGNRSRNICRELLIL